jgi:hypothetical protein
MILGSASLPTGFHLHEVGARVSATYVSDNLQYRSRQYTGEIDNRLELHSAGIRWLPRYILKYTAGTRENPDGSSNEFESHAILGGEVLNLGVIGLLKFKGDYTWRRRETDTGTGTKSTYLGEMGITSRTMKGARVGLHTSHELQRFGREISAEEAIIGIAVSPLEDQVRHTYRVDVQTAVSSAFTAGGNAMLLTTNDTRVRRIMASLSARIPRVNLPVRSSLIDERRALIGLPTQKLFEIQTRASLTIRRVRLVLSHTYSRDRQLTEEYRYQQLLAKLIRDFDVW